MRGPVDGNPLGPSQRLGTSVAVEAFALTGGTLVRTSAGNEKFCTDTFSDWRLFNYNSVARDLGQDGADRLANQMGRGTMRVLFKARNGDSVTVRPADASRTLHLVWRERPDSAVVLSDPVPKLDEYFATAILSEEETLPFLL